MIRRMMVVCLIFGFHGMSVSAGWLAGVDQPVAAVLAEFLSLALVGFLLEELS